MIGDTQTGPTQLLLLLSVASGGGTIGEVRSRLWDRAPSWAPASDETVRRSLLVLEGHGLIARTHGYPRRWRATELGHRRAARLVAQLADIIGDAQGGP